MEKNEFTYAELLKKLKGTGQLWEDPDFPAHWTSLSTNQDYKKYPWMRPKSIDKDAVLILDGPSRFDVKQFEKTYNARSRFFSALASFANNEKLFKTVVPDGQDFGENYIGAFRFRFWRFGQWREVIIDDILPTEDGELTFSYSTSHCEFWSPLLEKAYAKLYGKYSNLLEISQFESLQDLTGGICETFKLNDEERPKDFYNEMLKFQSLSSLMCCEMEQKNSYPKRKKGLIAELSYSITSVVEMNLIDGKKAKLIRIRNPRGNVNEWKDDWSDNSKMWDLVSTMDKTKYNENKTDGEFWMSFDDFVKNFSKFVVCHLSSKSIEDETDSTKHMESTEVEGSWIKNVNAGGSRDNLASFVVNAQYRIEITDADENDNDNTGAVIVGLVQGDMRLNEIGLHAIGYDIYPWKEPKTGIVGTEFFTSETPITPITNYSKIREVSCRYQLPIGFYIIVPSTSEPNQEGKYILRIFTHKPNILLLLDEESRRISIEKDISKRITDMTIDTIDEELKKIFEIISGGNGYIDAVILSRILNAILAKDTQCIKMKDFDGFSLDDCKSIIALYDYDFNGRMEFSEFLALFKNLRIWKNVFKEFDVDGNGVFYSYEYRNALINCGFSVSNSLFNVLVLKYVDPTNGIISFKDFVMSLIHLTNSFEKMEEDATVKLVPYDDMEDMVYM